MYGYFSIVLTPSLCIRKPSMRNPMRLSIDKCVCAETPETSPSMVWFKDESFHQTDPAQLELNWDPFNLTLSSKAQVRHKHSTSVSTQRLRSDIKSFNLTLNSEVKVRHKHSTSTSTQRLRSDINIQPHTQHGG